MQKPPLSWLQAFEAAGRTGSFKAAAEELHVSPSNISHQIRDLEAYLGTLLFSRQRRQVRLTREGEAYLPGLSSGFQLIREANAKLGDGAERFYIGAFPFLASELITPQLEAVRAALGPVDLRVFTHTRLEALTHTNPEERLDVVVAYGRGKASFPGLGFDKLCDVALVPVVGNSAPQLNAATEVLRQPLIRVLGPLRGWELWSERFGRAGDLLTFAVETDSYHTAMLSVERNEGVCLAVAPFIKPWLDAGRVRPLSTLALPIEDQAAYAVYAPHQAERAALRQFVSWLRSALT
ncbi:MAG: LysR family transcriptional regulator [Pseudomonadota bacterium]